MKQKIKILHLEDLPSDAELVARQLKRGKIDSEILVAPDKEAFVKALKDFSFDVILSDHSLAAFDSHEALTMVKDAGITVPFILVTATMNDEFAAKVMKDGAYDYILKDRLNRLPSAVINSIEKHCLEKKEQAAHERLAFHIENAPLGFIEWDNELHIKALSKQAEKIFGWSLKEFSTNEINGYTLVYNGDLHIATKAAEDLISGYVQRNTTQHRNITKWGEIIWCEWFNSVLRDKDGNVVSIMSLIQDITIQKEAEEKLNKANRLYTFISQINQTIVLVRDEDGLFFNSCRIAVKFGEFEMAWIGLFDKERQKISVVSQHGIPGEDIQLFNNVLYNTNGRQEQVLRTGKHYICNDITHDPELENWKPLAAKYGIQSCMVLPIRKSGSIIGSFNLYATKLNFFEKEEIALLLEVTGDISFALDAFEIEKKQKAAEALVVQKEKLFRAMIENSTDMKVLITRDGVLLYSSPSITKVLGYNPEEFKNRSALQLIHPDHFHDFIKNRTAIFKTPGKSFYFQRQLLHKNGNWIWCEGTLTNMLHEPGINAIVSNFRDISDRKLAEKNLLHSESRLKEAQSIAHIGNFEIDLANHSELWSDEMYKISGLNKEEVVPSIDLFLSLIHPDDLNYVKTVIEESTKTFQNAAFNFRFIRMDGQMRYGCSEARFESDENKKPIRLFGIFQDITERKLGEIERTKMVNDLMLRNTELEQFSYIISHNLRSPVANIIGASTVLEDSELSTEEKAMLNRAISNSVTKLDHVIKDLNHILEIKAQISGARELLHFSEMVDDIKISIKDLIDKNNIEIKYDFSEINTFLAMKPYLYSIFYNLISNSVKYRRPQIRTLIEIKSTSIENKIGLIFTDNGMGIDLQKKGEQVFGLYKRFHTNIEGKGMGLFMVKTQVEILGGKISLKSTENVGTEFKIEFESVSERLS